METQGRAKIPPQSSSCWDDSLKDFRGGGSHSVQATLVDHDRDGVIWYIPQQDTLGVTEPGSPPIPLTLEAPKCGENFPPGFYL